MSRSRSGSASSTTPSALSLFQNNEQYNLGDGVIYEPYEEPLVLSATDGYGYFPGRLGKHISEHHTIVRKLGWAAHSSVWLCEDKNASRKEFVAIKVLTTFATARIVDGFSQELKSLLRVKDANPTHPGYRHCLTTISCFMMQSDPTNENALHLCLVTDVLGTSLEKLRQEQVKRAFSSTVTNSIVKQVLLALDYLHGTCGITHTDIKPDNVLVVPNCPNDVLATTIDAYVREHPPSIYEPLHIPELSSKPIVTVASQPLPNFGLSRDLSNLSVKLVDFGTAIDSSAHLSCRCTVDPSDASYPAHYSGFQPDTLRAPEVTLGHPWGPCIDIWTVGCLTFECLTGHGLFSRNNECGVDLHLQQIVECLGPFPKTVLGRCSRRDEFFDREGNLLRTTQPVPTRLESRLASAGTIPPEDAPAAASFIRRCMLLDPVARPGAEELLRDA